MRIAIDARTICDAGGGPGAGVEHYTWSVIFALIRRFPTHRFLVLVPKIFSDERRLELVGSCRNAEVVSSPFFEWPRVGRHVFFPLFARLRKARVLFAPAAPLPFAWRGPSVLTIHDVAIFTHPEWFPEADAKSLSTQKYVPDSIARATRLVAVSGFTAQALAERFSGTATRTDVVYPGVTVPDHVTATGRVELPGEFVLCLGTIEPRKNLPNAIQAFQRFLAAHPERATRLRLVLAGKWGWKTDEVAALVEEMNTVWQPVAPDGIIHVLGPVTEDEKWELLSRAACLLFPSWEEGFGLPVLEAMSLGIPVVCSDRGSLPEVVDDAAFVCTPDDVEKMSLLLAQIMLMPEAAVPIAEAGQDRALRFTWEAAADGLMAAFEKAVNEKPAR